MYVYIYIYEEIYTENNDRLFPPFATTLVVIEQFNWCQLDPSAAVAHKAQPVASPVSPLDDPPAPILPATVSHTASSSSSLAGHPGQAYLDQMLAISVKEEEVVLRIQEADRAIGKLQDMLRETQQKLQRRTRAKDKVGGQCWLRAKDKVGGQCWLRAKDKMSGQCWLRAKDKMGGQCWLRAKDKVGGQCWLRAKDKMGGQCSLKVANGIFHK